MLQPQCSTTDFVAIDKVVTLGHLSETQRI